MVVVAHPFGNANVRAVVNALNTSGSLARFITTIGWSRSAAWLQLLPSLVTRRLERRSYDLPPDKIETHMLREFVRLAAGATQSRRLIQHERGWASIDSVWLELDHRAAAYLRAHRQENLIDIAYGYEDCAEQFFTAALEVGVRRAYDLPIAYWETAQRLLREEAERYPRWKMTLSGMRDSPEKLERKTRELELAELVLCPSKFVYESLPHEVQRTKKCVVVPFGSPEIAESVAVQSTGDRPLRVLFAGALTQRKGLADLFAAMKLVQSANVELVVMGSLLQPLESYRREYAQFRYEQPRPHAEVLRLMQSCDVLVLPSIVEGRALVQQEAMASGLPVIATRNAGADDLIEQGVTGFVVPIRSPEAIAEKIEWCAANRTALRGMGIAAQKRARQFTWASYGEQVLAALQSLQRT